MRSTPLALLAIVALTAQAQKNYSSSLDMDLPNVNEVDEDTRASWCRAQSDSCTILCDKDSSTNDCDIMDLSYKCICGSNNSAPALQYYQQTMPTFICTRLFEDCIQQNIGSADGQEDCTNNINDLCGTIPPSKAVKNDNDDDDDDDDSSPSTSTSSSASTPSPTNEESSGNSDNSGDDGNSAPGFGPKGAITIAVAGLVAGLVAIVA